MLILEGGGNFLMQHCGIIMTLDFLEWQFCLVKAAWNIHIYALEIQCESLENVLGTKAKFLGHQQAFLCYPFKCQII